MTATCPSAEHRLRPSVVCSTPSCTCIARFGDKCRFHVKRQRERCVVAGCESLRDSGYRRDFCTRHEVEHWRALNQRAGRDYCPECGLSKPIEEQRCGPCNAEADGMILALAREAP